MPNLIDAKRPVVFLPGWGFNGQVWSAVANHFDQARLLDLPCLPNIDLSAAVEYLDQHIPSQSIIVAWSLGGLIATELCYRLPHKCSKLVLVATTPKFSADSDWIGVGHPVVSEMIKRLKSNRDSIMKYFFRLVQFPDRNKVTRNYLSDYRLNIELYDKWLRGYLTLLFVSDLRSRYSQIQQPLLHILGKEDAVVKTDIEKLKRLNQNVVVEMIDGAGHAPFVTHQEDFMQVIERFLHSDNA